MKQGTHIRSVRAKRGAEILGCGLSTYWHYSASDPTFPKKRALSPRMSVWDENELIAWRDSKVAHKEPA
jgi:predicted DNA-binding transcriptional regulator AlpA